MFRSAGLLAMLLSLLLWTGCTTGPDTRPTGPGNRPDNKPAPQPTGRIRPVNVKYPITQARGMYTIRVTVFYGQGTSTAAKWAGELADAYRASGREAYVTDLGSRAVLTVGSFTDPKDSALYAAWKRENDDYLKRSGGRPSSFQQQMDRFYGGAGPLRDEPYPVEIEPLQMRMKLTQGKITQAQYEKWNQEYLNRRRQPAKDTTH